MTVLHNDSGLMAEGNLFASLGSMEAVKILRDQEINETSRLLSGKARFSELKKRTELGYGLLWS